MDEIYRRVVCSNSKEDCPYNKNHCCLGEINIRSLNGFIPLSEKHCCKRKNSKMVIGILQTE